MTKKTSPAYRASKEETIPINKLHPFSNHPFHIRHDLEFSELVDSISESGIITPIIVRPKVGVGYEVISGHRRWEACKELGIESIPARVEYIDDDEATILMVNSNIQREHVLPSEKAFAYKMRMEAMKHQGKATSSQLGTKLRTLDAMGKEVDESRNQIHRYIRLTYLQLREMPYNNERTWNERARFPYERLVVGVDRQNPDGAVAVIQVRNGINYLCDDYRGPYADGSDAQITQMAKKLVEVIGVDRVRPHTYTQRDGYTWVQVEKDMHITEWLYAHELCSSLQFTRFLNRDGRELFQVRDGQRVIETNADGTKRLRAVKNIDVTHAYVGHYGCHIQQYAEDNFRIGCYVAPEHPQPGDNLDKLQVYQITKGGCEYRFMNYAYSKSRIHAADYSSVYIANLPADYDLDRCFQEFNAPNRPLRYHMCSLSTSDIVVTTKNGNETAYYVDSIGFKDVSHLLPELHEVEAQHQKEQVQDEPER